MPFENRVWILSQPLNQHIHQHHRQLGNPNNYPNKCTPVVYFAAAENALVKMQRLNERLTAACANARKWQLLQHFANNFENSNKVKRL